MKARKETKKKENYHHGNLKKTLLINAIKIIQEKGIEKLTLKVLANKLNVSAPALYRHFSSKDELIDHVILYAFDLYDEKVNDVNKNKSLDYIEKLYHFGKTYINFATNNPNLFKIMFGTRFSTLRDISNREEAKGMYIVVDHLYEGQKQNIIKKDDPLIQVSVLHATLHGIVTLFLNDNAYVKDNLELTYDKSFEIIISGLMIKPINLKEKIEKFKDRIK